MKISPTAIRQKAFETAFRGYEKKEVTTFLEEMSVAMEQINQENLDLRSRLQQVEAEAKRLKDVEDSLFRTLKTAEDTGANIITEASEAADQIISEANSIAEQLTKESSHYAQQVQKHAEDQARIITTAAEAKAKSTIKEIRESMRSLIRSYEGLLEQREALVKSLKRLSQDALNQIELSDAHFFRIDGKAYQRAVEELSHSNHFTIANIAALAPQADPAQEEDPEMANATLDEETQETLEAMQHELEEKGELPVEIEEEPEQEAEEEVREEEPIKAEITAEEPEEIKEEVKIEEEIPVKREEKKQAEVPKAESPKGGSGSFFDQFD
ncbi:DivIVA domain-containing protein [Algoriphagus sp. H41]|uniref:DivIVA domain-containing protein n=1 Tax=Algoriphagus oliviformis TaxID=2811231 RepID=A0ABS3C5U5_9BACT|nr:DivIVA domain-containing protein [Algoriphagus oliviformis]MBN7812494.1 DivIVA domain-containing protein [Algoriphagus oliviformis]